VNRLGVEASMEKNGEGQGCWCRIPCQVGVKQVPKRVKKWIQGTTSTLMSVAGGLFPEFHFCFLGDTSLPPRTFQRENRIMDPQIPNNFSGARRARGAYGALW
jgi:hypothetical protein